MDNGDVPTGQMLICTTPDGKADIGAPEHESEGLLEEILVGVEQ